MSRTHASLLAALVVILSAAQNATACDHSTRSVRYVSYPTSHAKIVRTVVVEKPVVATVSLSRISTVVAKPTPTPPPTHESVEPGQTLRAATSFLGREQGHVILQMGDASLRCAIVDWNDHAVTFTLPNFGLQHDALARVDLVRPDGRLVRSYNLSIQSPADKLEKVLTVASIHPAPSAPAVAQTATATTGGLDLASQQAPPAPISVQVAR